MMPTALDNGQRSPRKLLRAVIARLLGQMTVILGGSMTTRLPCPTIAVFLCLGVFAAPAP